MIVALFKAFAQLSDPALRRVVRLSILWALACYLVLVAAIWLGLPHLKLFDTGWADTGADIALGLAALVLPILFFPALVTTIMGAMLDGVADAVEARHYPSLSPARQIGWGETILGSLRFLGLTVAINLLALPLYLALLVTGLSVVVAVLVNGYLLGREYFELVDARRHDPASMRLTFRHHLGKLWLAGAVVAVLFSIPIVNLVAPVVATAFMVHLSQSLRRQTDLL